MLGVAAPRSFALCALLGAPLAAHAQDGYDHQVLYFRPALGGALTLDVGFEGRMDRFTEAQPPAAAESLRLHLGYLYYVDPFGRLAVGGYAGGGFALSDGHRDGRADAGALVRWRGLTETHQHWSIGVFIEGGRWWLDGVGVPAETDAPDHAWRWAAGVETGPGMLVASPPHLFATLAARIGVEQLNWGAERATTVFAGIRLSFEIAYRAPERSEATLRGWETPDCSPGIRRDPRCPPPAPVEDEAGEEVGEDG